MLYRETSPGVYEMWDGEPIDDVVYPRDIQEIWTEQDLAAIGLYRPVRPDVPDGKRIASRSVQRVDGIVTYVYELEDIPPAAVPYTISDRQFAHALWKQGVITYDEAKAFATVGTIPALMQGLLDTMPAESRQDAELLVSGAKEFVRDHPTTVALSEAFGWTPEVTDEFWRYAASL